MLKEQLSTVTLLHLCSLGFSTAPLALGLALCFVAIADQYIGPHLISSHLISGMSHPATLRLWN